MSCRETEYYDYGHGETQEGYESYGKYQSLDRALTVCSGVIFA